MGKRHTGNAVEGMSTAEVEKLTGISRYRLTAYIKNGVVNPARASASPQSEMRWTIDQVWMASKVPALLEGGMTLKQIAELADSGADAVDKELQAQYMRKMREGRRGLKDVLYRSREVEDSRSVGRINGEYLRYIPQRYLALAPMPEAKSLVDPTWSSRLVELLNTAQTLGWSLADSTGFLSSIASNGADSTAYAFAALASPPMPAYSGMKAIDGGCYYAADPKLGAPGCDGTSCAACSRFGRAPSQSDVFEWRGRRDAHPELWDRTVMIDHLEKPYPSGIWSEYTKSLLAEGDDSYLDIEKSATVRPRLMPHAVQLPLGVTACVIPAGIFLCRQCDSSNQDGAFERMLGQASIMPQRRFSVEDEMEASRVILESVRRDQPETGPVPDPFARPHIAGDPKMKGWWQRVSNRELQRLSVPTEMALAPEDGYCVICSTLPAADRNDPTRYEMQLLVDASKVAPPDFFA